ncbi:MAG: glycosyltransferase [Porticoccaceae bacterium]|nr:glycosyltransferase [Porticoccaceae bacterium]
MLTSISLALLGVHFLLLLFLSFTGIHRLSLIFRWLKYRKNLPAASEKFQTLPKVTIQIPLYNERFVARRVVDAMAALDYPPELLQVQIVDDSDDDTSDMIAERVAYHRQQGVNIEHVQREVRHGFKAGALADAMEFASGEFIAIFDADFVPNPSVIYDAIHQFTDPKVAMVQLRWGHLNLNDSHLTRIQGVALDAHFGLEQWVRGATGALYNFNGTAGIWRKEAIIDAGNWSADTLTEDLDLSYRAQLRGWQLRYMPSVECPGELPADMNAFKSQQHRWAKGGIEVMRKLLRSVWRAPLSLGTKLESTFHLANNMAYLIMMIDTVFLLVPSLLIREHLNIGYTYWLDMPMLLMSTGGHLAYFLFGQVVLGRSAWFAISKAPAMLLLGIQLSFNNARAAAEALLGQRSPFIRTPKEGDRKTALGDNVKLRYRAVFPRGTAVELLLGLVYGGVLIWALSQQLWLALPFLLLLHVGFLSTAISSIRAAAQQAQ